jgi:hypothetical protein
MTYPTPAELLLIDHYADDLQPLTDRTDALIYWALRAYCRSERARGRPPVMARGELPPPLDLVIALPQLTLRRTLALRFLGAYTNARRVDERINAGKIQRS